MLKKVVIKVGGATLFHPSGFQTQVQTLIDEFRDDQVYLIVGGGDLVEAMRTAHRIYPTLSQEEIHWNCVELLDMTWGIAKSVMPLDAAIYDHRDLMSFAAWNALPKKCWVRVQSYYSRCRCEAIQPGWLPSSDWNTTTDVLAWLLGMTVQADRVVLMKQCACDAAWTMQEAAGLGVVDSELGRLAGIHFESSPQLELRSMMTG